MIEISHLVLMIVGELLLLTTAVAVISVVNAGIKRGRDRAAARKLVGIIKDDEKRRLAETARILTERFGLDETAADGVAKKINREERIFYQTLIKIYLQRDHVALLNLNVDFENAVVPYRTLELPPVPDSVGETLAANDEELQRLQDENERLSEELRITMDTLGRMLNEYSAIFAGGAVDTGKNNNNETPVAEPTQAPDDEAEISEEPVASEVNDVPKDESQEESVDDSSEEILLDDVIGEEAQTEMAPELDETVVVSPAAQSEDLDDELAELDDEFGDALDFDDEDFK